MSIDLQDSLSLAQRPRLKEACIKLQGLVQELEPDTKLPTMVELREQFGMSMKTINSAVRELERRQVVYCINGVGIYVASGKPRVRTANLGFMTNNIRHIQNLPYYDLIMDGMRAEAEKRDRHILIIDNIERFHQWEKIDGALFIDKHEKSYACPPLPHPPKGLPCLAVLNPLPGITHVTADDFLALKNLTRHLIDLGHRRIAYIAALDEGIAILGQRLQGYRAALQVAGIAADKRWVRELYMGDLQLKGEGFQDIGARHIERWMAKSWKEDACTAIVAQNDATALGMIEALQAAGYRVPEDISVVGFDGIAASQPRLTTVKAPLFDLGQTAVSMLCEWIENPALAPKNVALAGNLVIGETSAPPTANTT